MSEASCRQPRILYVDVHLGAEGDCACADTDRVPAIMWLHGDEACEGDCACAEPQTGTDLERLAEMSALWQISPEQFHIPVIDDHEVVFNPLVPVGVTVLNRPALEILASYLDPLPLDGTASRQLAGLGLLRPVDTSPLPAFSRLQTLTAWLHVTNACNLRCAYCYVAKSDEAMDKATGLAAVDAIVRSATHHSFKAIKLKYAGGEATLNFRLIQLLHGYAQDQAAAHGLTLQEVILSNGVGLSQTMLDFVRDAGMRLMISLDGLGAEQNAQRRMANGAPSASLVQRTIQRACERGLLPHISITVSPANAASLAHTVRFVLDHGLLFNLNFVRGEAAPSFCENPVGGWATEIIAGILQALAVIEGKLPRHRLIDDLLDRASFAGAHSYPCGAGRNYLAINQRGKIATCHMILDDPVSDVWADDPLGAVQQAWVEHHPKAAEKRETCSGCMWRNVCGGGCPLMNRRAAGEHDAPPLYCSVYRAILPELLRLEGLRLLKWQETTVA